MRMSFEVGVVAHFDATHHLVGDFGPASAAHGHSYTIHLGVRGERLRDDGTLFDITLLQAAMNAVLADLEGRDLNELPELARPNPTAEVVARYFFVRVATQLAGQGLSELEARVWESPEAYGSYTGPLA
jgi:6-pyruvoyltetrahydropterin/6-carboxytetrahydropterin synthase